MAKIWYSVCGEGLGHAVRSHTVLSQLQSHEILITAAERAYPYLRERHRNVIQIAGNTYVYENNAVRRAKTVVKFLKEWPGLLYRNFSLLPTIRKFNPDLVISDFESAAHYFSLYMGKPCIAVDNIHLLTKCEISVCKPWYVSPMMSILLPPARHYYISSFVRPRGKNKNVTIVDPIIRKEVKKLRPEKGDFILVYQTSPTNIQMIPVLEQSGQKFKIYGMPGQKDRKNLEFVDFGDHFLDDLRKCRYVIVNGGFTVITEALYLKKPVLCIPIEKQFEQEFNAMMVKRLGYGSHTKSLAPVDLESFEKHIAKYVYNLKKLREWDDSRLITHIESWLK